MTFENAAECLQHLERFGTLLDVLEDGGMNINLQKTEAMITIHGRNQNILQRQCIQRTANGFCLKIPRQHTTSLIRLTSRCGYLGIQLSYGNPQLETMQRRLNSSQMAFKRLSLWLRRKRGLSTQYKLAI